MGMASGNGEETVRDALMENKLPGRNPHPCGKKNMTNIMRQTFFEAMYMKQAGVFNTEMITEAIIGKANLVNCVRIDEAMRELIRKQHIEEYALGYFVLDHYAWVLEEPELFDRPIPATGKQGLWNFYGDL